MTYWERKKHFAPHYHSVNRQSEWAAQGVSSMGRMIREKGSYVGTPKQIAKSCIEALRSAPKPSLP